VSMKNLLNDFWCGARLPHSAALALLL